MKYLFPIRLALQGECQADAGADSSRTGKPLRLQHLGQNPGSS